MNNILKNITHVGFDADDTLWPNMPFFIELEKLFVDIMSPYAQEKEVLKRLFETEMSNMEIYGYGVKPFVLSVIETGIKLSNNSLPQKDILRLIDAGKYILNSEISLLPGVCDALNYFKSENLSIVLATKGDALDQERKLQRSGLESCFAHVEVMSDKQEENYQQLFTKLGIEPDSFLMIGNSVKSDILPVLKMGGKAIHIPYDITWEHESVDTVNHDFPVCKDLKDLLLSIQNS